MKRSEMIDKIYTEAHKVLGMEEPRDLASIAEVKRDVSVILDLAVKFGMQPPKYVETDPGHFPGDQFTIEKREWEEE